MRPLLYLLASGWMFFVGLAVVVTSLGITSSRQQASIGRIASWIGALAVALSGVPSPPVLYLVFGAAFAAWQISATAWPASRRTLMAKGSLFAIALVLAGLEVPWHVMPRMPLAPGSRLVVLGDSISAGLGASDLGTWPDRIGHNRGVPVVNLARAGATTSSALEQARIMPPGPATVVIEIGGNDLLSGLPSREFRKALAPLLATAGGPGRSVVMFELPLLPLQNAYGEVQRDLSRRYGVTLLPRRLLAEVLADEGRTLDGLHLSSAGHEWFANRVWEIFRP